MTMTTVEAQAETRAEVQASARAKRKARRGTEVLNGAARFRKPWVPWLWMAIPLIVVFAFYIFPFFNTVLLSFTNAKPLGGGSFVGLANYVTLFTDPDFARALVNSLVYVVCVVPFMTFLPLLLACLVREKIPGIGFFRSMYYLPAIASVVVVSLAWTFLLKDNGLINETLMGIGLTNSPIPFVSNHWWLLASSMVLTLWKGLPYYMVLYLSALANVDKSLYEATEMDGANAIQRFWTVTVPGVRIMMYLVAVLSAIGAMKVFTEVYLLSNGTGGIAGEGETLAMYIRDVGVADTTYGSLGLGSAASVVLFLLTVGLMVASRRINRKAEEQ